MAENGGFDVTGLILGPDEMERFLTALWSEPGAPAVYAEGPPGQGKSDIFRQVARNLKAEYHERILVTMEPSDITGIPALDTENALFKYCPDALFEKCSTKYPDGGPVVIMLDDLATAPPQLQAAAFALVLNRRAGPHILRDNVFIGAAGNREEDNAGANELLTALANRFLFIYMESNAEAWAKWAVNNSKHPSVVGFIRKMPNRLQVFDPDAKEKPHATPRSWTMLADVIARFDKIGKELDFRIMAGIVGNGPALEFNAYLDNSRSAVDIADIIKDPKTAKVPGDREIDALYATICNLEHFLGVPDNHKHVKAIAAYACREEMLMELGLVLGQRITSVILKMKNTSTKTDVLKSNELKALREKYKGHMAAASAAA
jgi:hypothetical protein